ASQDLLRLRATAPAAAIARHSAAAPAIQGQASAPPPPKPARLTAAVFAAGSKVSVTLAAGGGAVRRPRRLAGFGFRPWTARSIAWATTGLSRFHCGMSFSSTERTRFSEGTHRLVKWPIPPWPGSLTFAVNV